MWVFSQYGRRIHEVLNNCLFHYKFPACPRTFYLSCPRVDSDVHHHHYRHQRHHYQNNGLFPRIGSGVLVQEARVCPILSPTQSLISFHFRQMIFNEIMSQPIGVFRSPLYGNCICITNEYIL